MTTIQDPFERFALSVVFQGPEAIIRVAGVVGLLTAAELGAIIDAEIDRGHRMIVLDLAEMDFMGASGLMVIAAAATRLASSGGSLSIRSPSVELRLILERPDWATLVVLEQPLLDGGGLGSEQSAQRRAEPSGRVQSRGPDQPTTSERDALDRSLCLVVTLATAAVGGADGVSVSLRRDGYLTTVAATDQTVSAMDADQYAVGQGPCIDAAVEGRWFHVASLAGETRWPAFTPLATALGINAILSSPLLCRGRPIGSLNIYSRTVAGFAPKDQAMASLFAAQASIMLTTAEV